MEMTEKTTRTIKSARLIPWEKDHDLWGISIEKYDLAATSRYPMGAQYLSFCSAPSHSRQAATPTPRRASLALASWTLNSSAERFRLFRRKIAALA
jgi:hypothetical protein